MWFKFNPSDLLRKWPYRSLENFGTYCTLYCLAWDNQGLPDNPEHAANISGLSRASIEQVWGIFKQQCIIYLGKLMPPEMVDGIHKYRDKIEAGKAGAKARWTENKRLTDAAANADSHTDAISSANTEEIKSKNKSRKKLSKSHSPAADAAEKPKAWTSEFFDAYCSYHDQAYEFPYSPTKADWGQLGQLRKRAESAGRTLTLKVWEQGVKNYFASDLAKRSICDLATYQNFVAYYKSPLDRFNKPIGVVNGTTQNQPATRKESTNERRLREFYEDLGIAPPESDGDTRGDDARYERLAADGTLGEGVYLEVLGQRPN